MFFVCLPITETKPRMTVIAVSQGRDLRPVGANPLFVIRTNFFIPSTVILSDFLFFMKRNSTNEKISRAKDKLHQWRFSFWNPCLSSPSFSLVVIHFFHSIFLFFHLNKLIVYTFPHAQGNCLSLPFAILVDLLHSLLSLFLFSLSLRFSTFFLSHRKFDLLYRGRNER